MIKTFRCKHTEKLFNRISVARFRAFEIAALDALLTLDAAERLSVLAAVPGNHFEGLRGDRRGQYSIRVNRQWRVCFSWRDGDAFYVEIVDYHKG